MNSQEVRKKYRRRKITQLVACFFVLPILGILGYVYSNPEKEIWVFNHDNARSYLIIVSIFIVIFTRLNWRCPRCNVFLGSKGSEGYCTKCNTNFFEL